MGQHRLAEFYLRGFVQRPGPRILFEFDKGTGFQREVKPKHATAESATAFTVDGPNKNAAEDLLGNVERMAKPVFVAIRNAQPLPEEYRGRLAEFASLSYIRSTRTAEHFAQIRALFAQDSIEGWLRSPAAKIEYMLREPDATADEYDSIVEEYIVAVRDGRIPAHTKPQENSQLTMLRHRQEWRDVLLKLCWSIEIAPAGSFFIVGDEPLCARHSDRPFDSSYVPLALPDSKVEVSFPLSKHACLVARWQSDKSRALYIPVAPDRVDDLNIRSVMCAHHRFWSPVRASKCDEYIQIVGGRTINISVQIPSSLSDFLNSTRRR